LTRPKEKLAASGMGWTEDFPAGAVKAIGALEVLAAIGLIVPAAFGIAPVIVPLAALGLVLLMIGAAITHARRKEREMIIGHVVRVARAAVLVGGRSGPSAWYPAPPRPTTAPLPADQGRHAEESAPWLGPSSRSPWGRPGRSPHGVSSLIGEKGGPHIS